MACKCLPFVLCRKLCSPRGPFSGRSNGPTPRILGDLDDCAGLSALLYDSLLPCAASFMSHFACQPCFSSLIRMHASSSTASRTLDMCHSRRRAGGRCSPLASSGQNVVFRRSLPPIYIRMPSNSACMAAFPLRSITSAWCLVPVGGCCTSNGRPGKKVRPPEWYLGASH